MNMRPVFVLFFLLLTALPATAQENRVVALVITVGKVTERADVMQALLHTIGVETLRADNPNNAELRSILIRFSREAAISRAAFVYLHTPVVDFQKQSFVLPAGATLNRGTDLFTQALPIQAFSRSAGQAGQGGATIATLGAVPFELPDGTEPSTSAPGPISQFSPVLVGPENVFPEMIAAFENALQAEEVEVSTLLRRMSVLNGVTISEFPKQPIFLRTKSGKEEPETIPVAVPQTEDTEESPEITPAKTEEPASAAPPETLEELALLEQALSRATKRLVQNRLRNRGHYKGLVDGIFGPQTRAAIEAFQADREEEPTGLLTRRQLIELSS